MIIQTTVDMTYANDFCLSFWYLMFGKDILSLKVDMNVPRFRQSKQQIFQKSNQRSESKIDWRYAQVKLKVPELTDSSVVAKYQNVVFTFIATRGPSYLSDIAVDDVMLRPVECQNLPVPGTTASPNQIAAMATWTPPVTEMTTSTTPEPLVSEDKLELVNRRKPRLLTQKIKSGKYRVTCGGGRAKVGDETKGEFFQEVW